MIQVGIIIPHHYKLLSVAALLDVFETINKFYRDAGQQALYQVTLFSLPGMIPGEPAFLFGNKLKTIRAKANPGLILLPSFTTENMKHTIGMNRQYIPWLIKQYNAGSEIACFCTGAFLLAATGLLNGKAATTHVDACKAFSEIYPAVDLRPDKTVTMDSRLYTSGGATSTFHLLLHLVQQHCGREIAVKAAKVFAIDMDRQNQSYFSTFYPSRQHTDDLVATAQEKIEASYHDTGTIEEMIRDIPSSRRNIVRRFKQVTGLTPIEYLQLTRIEAAKKLLEQTSHQMTEVICRSGYNDAKAFRKVFRRTVGMTPTKYREKFQVR